MAPILPQLYNIQMPWNTKTLEVTQSTFATDKWEIQITWKLENIEASLFLNLLEGTLNVTVNRWDHTTIWTFQSKQKWDELARSIASSFNLVPIDGKNETKIEVGFTSINISATFEQNWDKYWKLFLNLEGDFTPGNSSAKLTISNKYWWSHQYRDKFNIPQFFKEQK